MAAFLVSTRIVALAEISDKTQAAKRLPLRLVHGVAATIFAVLGLMVLLNVGATTSPVG